MLLVLVAFFLLSGGGGGLGDLGSLSGQTLGPGTGSSTIQQECQTGADANERDDCRVVAVVNSVQAYWQKTLRGYEAARTRFFDGVIRTGCGPASPAVGAVLLPGRPLHLHRSRVLRAAAGPARRGVHPRPRVRASRPERDGSAPKREPDTGPQGGQVRVELQADCYAGLWVGNALSTGFVEEITRQDVADALDAAAAVGDDRIQERAQGRVTPESWTHGSSEQRQSWFVRGIEGFGPQSCNTFRGRV